jgi:hypothetical protein
MALCGSQVLAQSIRCGTIDTRIVALAFGEPLTLDFHFSSQTPYLVLLCFARIHLVAYEF